MGKGKNRRRSVKAGPSKSSSAVVVVGVLGIVLHAYIVVGNAVRAPCMLCGDAPFRLAWLDFPLCGGGRDPGHENGSSTPLSRAQHILCDPVVVCNVVPVGKACATGLLRCLWLSQGRWPYRLSMTCNRFLCVVYWQEVLPDNQFCALVYLLEYK